MTDAASMGTGLLASALEQEHREIDDGIAAFTAAPGDRQPSVRAIGALRRHIYLIPGLDPAAFDVVIGEASAPVSLLFAGAKIIVGAVLEAAG